MPTDAGSGHIVKALLAVPPLLRPGLGARAAKNLRETYTYKYLCIYCFPLFWCFTLSLSAQLSWGKAVPGEAKGPCRP